MWGNSIKILIAGARYTGKGQIGRAWGQTTADVPTLQPVLLYERQVEFDGELRRVVAWVLSFDPEFEALRRHFYPGGDALILTFNLLGETEAALGQLEEYTAEIEAELGTLPPYIVMGVRLQEGVHNAALAEKAREWVGVHGNPPYFEADFTNSPQFSLVVDQSFATLLSLV